MRGFNAQGRVTQLELGSGVDCGFQAISGGGLWIIGYEKEELEVGSILVFSILLWDYY